MTIQPMMFKASTTSPPPVIKVERTSVDIVNPRNPRMRMVVATIDATGNTRSEGFSMSTLKQAFVISQEFDSLDPRSIPSPLTGGVMEIYTINSFYGRLFLQFGSVT